MNKVIFKQAFRLWKENRLLSCISILGTAFAIAMIMVIVLIQRTQVSSFGVEDQRERTLIVHWLGIKRANDIHSFAALSYQTVKSCFYPLTTPEAVGCASIMDKKFVSIPGGSPLTFDHRGTDDGFWKVFSFQFIDGKPFTKADFDAGLPQVVLSESSARKLFGRTDVTGQQVDINFLQFTVCGVVSEVSMLNQEAYGQIWTPLTSNRNFTWANDVLGMVQVYILAPSRQDFEKIRNEVDVLTQQYDAGFTDFDILLQDQPDTYFEASTRPYANSELNKGAAITRLAITLALLMLVPAITLSSMTLSRMRKRLPEMGVRRAFGSSRSDIIQQIFSENLILTLCGGLLGLIVSFCAMYFMKDMLSPSSVTASGMGKITVGAESLFSPWVFLLAVAFCLLLNMLSALIPAWRTSRVEIVNALK